MLSERAQALEQIGYFLDAIDEIATIGAAPKGHIGMAVQPPSFHMTPSTAKNIKWNTREIRSKLALLAPAEGVSPQPDLHAAIMNLRCVVPSDVDDADVVTGSLSGTHALAYKRGHRDARHAAAELAMEASAPVSPVEPTPEQRCGSSDPERRRPTPEGSTR